MLKRAYGWVKDFYDPDINLYASSLSFYTIFSIIPLLLVSFSLFIRMPNFSDYYHKIKHFIFSNLVPAQQDIIAGHIETFLQNSSKLGIIGFVFVIIASIMFFQNYEYIVYKIFKSPPRSFFSSLTVYWTLITLTPIGLALSFFLSGKIQHLLKSSHYTHDIDFLAIFPYLIIWLLFFIIYKISATLNISIKAAAISSFIASLIWEVGKNLFVYYVIYSKTYTTLYGSFSAILFFLLWLYISWIIFLYGLKLCKVINDKYQRRKYEKIENAAMENTPHAQEDIEKKEP